MNQTPFVKRETRPEFDVLVDYGANQRMGLRVDTGIDPKLLVNTCKRLAARQSMCDQEMEMERNYDGDNDMELNSQQIGSNWNHLSPRPSVYDQEMDMGLDDDSGMDNDCEVNKQKT